MILSVKKTAIVALTLVLCLASWISIDSSNCLAYAQEVEVEAGDGAEEPTPEENPLIQASYTGDVAAVRDLLSLGHNVNFRNPNGWTPIIFAVENGHYEVFETLVEAGADINVRENDGWTALMLAAYHGDSKLVQLLLKYGADPLVANANGYGAHSIAFFQEHHEASRLIANAGLVSSILRSDANSAVLMVMDGADVNFQTETGWTALMLICTEGSVDLLEKLLQRTDIDLNLAENDGWTALMFAVNNRHPTIVSWLLERGADPGVRSLQGYTAYQLAIDRGISEVQVVFEEWNKAYQKAAVGAAGERTAPADEGSLEAAEAPPVGDGGTDEDDAEKKNKWGFW